MEENASVGDTVGSLSSSDPDCGSVSYRLVNSAAGKFKLSGNRVLLDFRPNYESYPNKSVNGFFLFSYF